MSLWCYGSAFSTWWFYWNLKSFCITLHLVGLLWNRSLYFGQFSRALFVLSLLVNSPFAELSLQNLCNKWGGGYKGVQTSHLPYIAFPTEHPCFSRLPTWPSDPFRLQNSSGLPYPSPFSTTSHPTAPLPPKKTKVFAFKLLYATRPRTGRIKTIKCFRCSSRPIMSDVRVSAWREPKTSKKRTFPFIVRRMFLAMGNWCFTR